jgi:DNA-binding transcriptional MerR regulator/methylmalonyl-CoA mutase cobalamin-binding subunit
MNGHPAQPLKYPVLVINAPSDQSLLSIAEVETETGLQKDTLRVWERRYEFPQPVRNERGDRLYPAEQVARLLMIKRLMDQGHRPGKVVPMCLAQLGALEGRPLEPRDSRSRPPATDHELADWLKLLKGDRPEQLRAAIRQVLLRDGLSRTIEQLLGPLGWSVGEAWRTGEISIYQEHMYTDLVQSVLREALTALESPGEAGRSVPTVLLTTLADEQHTTGLLMAECFFALEHCARITLGANTPVGEVIRAAERYQPHIVALSVSSHAPRTQLMASLERLRRELPPGTALWLGGGFWTVARRRLPQGVRVVSCHADLIRELGELGHQLQV